MCTNKVHGSCICGRRDKGGQSENPRHWSSFGPPQFALCTSQGSLCPGRMLLRRPTNTRTLSMLSWQPAQYNVAGKQRFAQVGCLSSISISAIKMLKVLGIQGQAQQQAVKVLSSATATCELAALD